MWSIKSIADTGRTFNFQVSSILDEVTGKSRKASSPSPLLKSSLMTSHQSNAAGKPEKEDGEIKNRYQSGCFTHSLSFFPLSFLSLPISSLYLPMSYLCDLVTTDKDLFRHNYYYYALKCRYFDWYLILLRKLNYSFNLLNLCYLVTFKTFQLSPCTFWLIKPWRVLRLM